MQTLKAELEQMHALKAELQQLKTQLFDMGSLRAKIETLTAEVQGLQTQAASITTLSAEVDQLKDNAASRPFSVSMPQTSTPILKKPFIPGYVLINRLLLNMTYLFCQWLWLAIGLQDCSKS